MRLKTVERGDSLKHRVMFVMMRFVLGGRAPDVVRSLMFHRPFFGAPMNKLFQAALRGSSSWSVGERELFAAFVSSLNRCVF